MPTIRKVILRGEAIVSEEFQAGAALTPGHLIHFSTGKWVKHADADDTAMLVFALEREENGQEITDDYVTNDYVKAAYCHGGMVVGAIIPSGEDVVPGTILDSDGAGRLKVVDTDSATDDTQRGAIVGISLDTATPTVDTRIRVLLR